MSNYNCGAGNCGNGQCIHKALKEKCPHCGAQMIEVTTTGHKFCSGNFELCGFEVDVSRPSEVELDLQYRMFHERWINT